MLLAYAIDHSCLQWEKKCDGSTGACLYYNNHEMAWMILAVFASCKVLNVLCGLIAWRMYAYKRRRGKLPRRPEHTPTVAETGNGATENNIERSSDIVIQEYSIRGQAAGIKNPTLDEETSYLE